MTEHNAAHEEQPDTPQPPDERARALLKSPLLIGGIAYAILGWLILTVFLLMAWKLFG